MVRRVARRFERGPFEAAIALAAVVGAIAYLADPHAARRAAIGHVAGGLLPYWTMLYGVGGLAILVGMLILSLRLEVMGLLLFAAALLINAVGIGRFFGVQGTVSLATFAALALACVLRVRFLLAAYRREMR